VSAPPRGSRAPARRAPAEEGGYNPGLVCRYLARAEFRHKGGIANEPAKADDDLGRDGAVGRRRSRRRIRQQPGARNVRRNDRDDRNDRDHHLGDEESDAATEVEQAAAKVDQEAGRQRGDDQSGDDQQGEQGDEQGENDGCDD
jgi:hypothetical protein